MPPHRAFPVVVEVAEPVRGLNQRRTCAAGRVRKADAIARRTESDLLPGRARRDTVERTFVFDADHPAVLVGQDHGPTPVEFVLHALAACLTAGLANIAASRRVRLTEVRSTVTGDIDLNGILGLNRDVRNGFEQITLRLTIKGDAPAETLREIVERSRARSAVYDIITNRVPVTIEVDTHPVQPTEPSEPSG